MGIPTLPMRSNHDSWTVALDGSAAHKSATLYLDSDGATPQKLTAQNGALLLNGVVVGAGSGSFDNSGTGLSSTSLQAAIVELKTLIDQINAVLS